MDEKQGTEYLQGYNVDWRPAGTEEWRADRLYRTRKQALRRARDYYPAPKHETRLVEVWVRWGRVEIVDDALPAEA